MANPKELENYAEARIQKLIIKILKLVVNYNYGFQQNNFYGLDLSKVDLNKLLVVGNYLDVLKEKNEFMLAAYDLIEKFTGMKSDGVVTFDEETFVSKGINAVRTSRCANHFESSSNYFNDELKRILTK